MDNGGRDPPSSVRVCKLLSKNHNSVLTSWEDRWAEIVRELRVGREEDP